MSRVMFASRGPSKVHWLGLVGVPTETAVERRAPRLLCQWEGASSRRRTPLQRAYTWEGRVQVLIGLLGRLWWESLVEAGPLSVRFPFPPLFVPPFCGRDPPNSPMTIGVWIAAGPGPADQRCRPSLLPVGTFPPH